MIRIKSKSEKRLIIEGLVNGKKANFLVDTGASIALISDRAVRRYGLIKGREYNGTILGAGGEIENNYICNSLVDFYGKKLGQFVITDIGNIVESIDRETGVAIIGIISLPQMKFAGIQIDANDNLIIIE